MGENNTQKVYEATGQILSIVQGFDPDEINLVFKHVRELMGGKPEAVSVQGGSGKLLMPNISGTEPGPAFFVKDKKPQSASQRVACLAYYLKHFRGLEEFKTQDITVLANEFRLPPFSNASLFVNEAAKAGFLTRVGKGNKAITPGGEAYVEALPDVSAAKAAMQENTLGAVRKSKAKKPNYIKK